MTTFRRPPLGRALLAAAALVLAGVAAAGAAAPSSSLTPEEIIAARQAAYDLSVMDMAEMKMAIKDGLDIRKQFYPAKTLGRWARVLPTLFPPGTGQGETTLATHARPEIWTNRADFEKAAQNYAAAADKLAETAQSGDASAFAAQLEATDKTCDSCHDRFKAK